MRGAGTFDRHGRLGEQRLAIFELLHQLPGVGGVLVAVVGRYAMLAKGLWQTFDFFPGQAQARAHNQVFPGHALAAVERQGVLVGQ